MDLFKINYYVAKISLNIVQLAYKHGLTYDKAADYMSTIYSMSRMSHQQTFMTHIVLVTYYSSTTSVLHV